MITLRLAVSIFFIGLISSSLYANIAEMDQCQLAIDTLKNKNSDLISVIKMNTSENNLYSNTVYNSIDCHNFIKKFTVMNPEVIKGKHSLCMVLPAGEIDSNLRCIKFELCITPGNCKSVTIQLTANKEKKYIAADPKYIEINF